MNIRPYTSTDQPQIVALFDDFQDYIVSLDPLKRLRRLDGYGQSYLEQTLQKIEKNKGAFLVAEENGKIIGLVVGIIKTHEGEELLEAIPSTFGEVIELYVVLDERSNGLGSELLSVIEKYFKDQHCDAVFIEVFAPNERAKKFYERHGYGVRDYFLAKKIN
ncbi:hypothetical protein C5B42_02265 [Candidatus Cerribacteria bacterium 'Amazon FNV 2010 28 9']|uniref:N-acetyltransferase domain-containing protein n=1 Tax=Candidatus Cerribacteria bacterium 'Amazon FNV 2010 28 9' TaxID=2081795 RepID=A0A317JT86_9BACT|nr:MAG: hypothetical protein C5B42_02265 [Candidatus Cerribacteria bacterium 'Amazon FNV 2010 28 9']